eukprot:Gb_11458 [translate_table: standard]
MMENVIAMKSSYTSDFHYTTKSIFVYWSIFCQSNIVTAMFKSVEVILHLYRQLLQRFKSLIAICGEQRMISPQQISCLQYSSMTDESAAVFGSKNENIFCNAADGVAHAKASITSSDPNRSVLFMKEEELGRIFNALDSDADGMVNANDIKNLLIELGLVEFNCEGSYNDDDDYMETMLGSPPEYMTLDDFCRLCVCLFNEKQSPQTEQYGMVEKGELIEAFSVFDKDGDGFISPHDLRQALLSLGSIKAGDELQNCEKMIREFDGNCDGKIDFTEFEEMMMKTMR